jgi:hypothetical protein
MVVRASVVWYKYQASRRNNMERKPEDITADNYTQEDLGAVLEDHADEAVPCDPHAEERVALEQLYYRPRAALLSGDPVP